MKAANDNADWTGWRLGLPPGPWTAARLRSFELRWEGQIAYHRSKE